MKRKKEEGNNIIKRKNGFRTISSKILILIGGTVFLSFLVLLLIISNITSKSVTKIRNQELTAESKAAANDINSYFIQYYQTASDISHSSDVQALVNETDDRTKMEQASTFTEAVNTLHNMVRQ